MQEIQLSTEGISIDEVLETLSPYARESELQFNRSTTRGDSFTYELLFALFTNLGASLLYDALKQLKTKKPETRLVAIVKDDVVEVDVTTDAGREVIIEKHKDLVAIKVIKTQ